MAEGYLTGGDSLRQLIENYDSAQTFRVSTPLTVHLLDLNMKIIDPSIPVLIRIYYANGNHEPYGDTLSWQTDWTIGPEAPDGTRRCRFQMKPFNCIPEEYFFISVYSLYRYADKAPSWVYDAGDATYANGIRLWRNHPADDWTKEYNDDHMFYIFGTPPVPKPPPLPPIPNFATLAIEQILTASGYKIIVTTSIPCHLYMYYTLTEPEKHRTSRERRGVLWKWALTYCFVTWVKNEQEEEGDTIYHSFIKEPWPTCETRWFTFRAKVNNLMSPSTSPIFKKHRVWAPTTHDFYPDAAPETSSVDGSAWEHVIGGTDWADLIARPGDSAQDFLEAWYLVQFISHATPNKWFHLERGILLFDTAIIPLGAAILSATLSLYSHQKRDPTGIKPDIAIFSSNPASNTAVVPGDFTSLGSTPLSNIIPYDDWIVDGWNVFTLNDDGKAAIAKNGITKLGARNVNYDVAGVPPVWTLNAWGVFEIFYADNIDYIPKLTVTYAPP